MQRGHPEKNLDYTMTNIFPSSFKSQNKSTDYITLFQTYNPITKFNNIIHNSLNDFHDNCLKNAFENKKLLPATRQAKGLQNLLIRAWFDVVPKLSAPPKNIGLCNFQVERWSLHRHNHINSWKEFKFKLKSGRYHIWKHYRYSDFKSRDLIYLITCINYEGINIRETE